mmetsp:Transcript_60140/g.191052  ORF Transcript_60140/g.191052 Transcript_60140/m.191052 type:complete len:503 (+) Transcript_60140:41-1549(+)
MCGHMRWMVDNRVGYTVELGANWVHGRKRNKLNDLVAAAGLEGVNTEFEDADMYNPKTGELMPADDFDVNWLEEDMIDCMEAYSGKIWKDGLPDRSAQEVLKDECGWEPEGEVENVLEWTTTDYDYGKPPWKVSTKHMVPDPDAVEQCTEFDWVDFFIKDPRGYVHFLDLMSGDFTEKIRLGEVVEEVTYSATGVVVKTSAGQHTAKYAVSTLSNGALLHAARSSMFSPPLPGDKVAALEGRPMVTYTKIFLTFPSKFWGDRQFYFYPSARRGWLPLWHNLDCEALVPGSKTLMVTMVDERSAEFIAMPEAQQKSELMEVVRAMFGAGAPEFTAITFHDWANDPLFRGSWSSPSPAAPGSDPSALAIRNPVDRLFFAGEGTYPLWGGTLHAALYSGELVAETIAACMDNDNSFICTCARDPECDEAPYAGAYGVCPEDAPPPSDDAGTDAPSTPVDTAAPTNAPTNAPTTAGPATAAPDTSGADVAVAAGGAIIMAVLAFLS